MAYSYVWTIPSEASTFILESVPIPQAITVQSNKKEAVGNFDVVMTTTIVDTNENPSQTFTQTVSFTVGVIDPCDTTTMTPINLSAQTIINGDSYTWTFSEAVLQIETDNEG